VVTRFIERPVKAMVLVRFAVLPRSQVVATIPAAVVTITDPLTEVTFTPVLTDETPYPDLSLFVETTAARELRAVDIV
jgi:hypothetical protein